MTHLLHECDDLKEFCQQNNVNNHQYFTEGIINLRKYMHIIHDNIENYRKFFEKFDNKFSYDYHQSDGLLKSIKRIEYTQNKLVNKIRETLDFDESKNKLKAFCNNFLFRNFKKYFLW